MKSSESNIDAELSDKTEKTKYKYWFVNMTIGDYIPANVGKFLLVRNTPNFRVLRITSKSQVRTLLGSPDQIKRYDVQIFFQKIISEFSAYEFSIA